MIVEYLPLESVKIDINQPRKIFDKISLEQLQESIRLNGIEVPLIVRECEDKDSIYILLDGERRLRSAKALGIREVPCIIDKIKFSHPQMQEIDIVSKQLRLDFLKNKLTGEELDAALYDLWLSLETVSQETLDAMGIKVFPNKDWRIPYISKKTGVGYTQITMSLNKEDFKQRNKNFHDKISKEIENDPTKSKRYNRILGETSRHEGFRTDDDKRKTVIEEYLNESISGDGKELRDSLKKISETESPTEEEIRQMFGLEESVKDKDTNLDLKNLRNKIYEINNIFEEIVSDSEKQVKTLFNIRESLGHINQDLKLRLKTTAINTIKILEKFD